MAVNVRPLGDRVLVKPLEASETKKGGIIIPDTAKEKPQQGTVVSISEVDEKGNKPSVKVGDKVLYGKYAGTEITHTGKEYLIMRESDIFAIL